jgi:hypothetical protein
MVLCMSFAVMWIEVGFPRDPGAAYLAALE